MYLREKLHDVGNVLYAGLYIYNHQRTKLMAVPVAESGDGKEMRKQLFITMF